MEQEAPVPGRHGQVSLVLADHHVVTVLVGEAWLILLAGVPAALLAPADLGTQGELPQPRHCSPIVLLLLGLPRIRSGILLDPFGLLRRLLRPLLRDPGPRAASSASANLAVDFDHNFDDKKNLFLTWCPGQDLLLRSLR
jgi:hypothetical protein